MSLHQSEIFALKRILEDHDAKVGLRKFLEMRSHDCTTKCKEYLLGSQRDVELASRHACFAAAYDELMDELTQFVKEQLEG